MPNEDDDHSLVLPPRDYSDIVKLQQENILDQFLEHPTTAALETITGAFAGGGKGLLVSAGRIAQGLVKGQIYDVLADEIRRLREAGKLPDNLGETKRGLYTWAELCAIIDSECPDADRMEALKAAFYNVNKVSQEDDAQIFTYQLWQIAKKLESADVILLKAVHEKNAQLSGLVDLQWANQAAAVSGLGSAEIVQNCIDRLAQLRVTYRMSANNNQGYVTDLGWRLIQNIQTYKVDLAAATAAKKRAD